MLRDRASAGTRAAGERVCVLLVGTAARLAVEAKRGSDGGELLRVLWLCL